jgi:hypothetical protein
LQGGLIPVGQSLNQLVHEAVVYSGNSNRRNHFGGWA